MTKYLLILVFLFFSPISFGKELWWHYFAQYEAGPGSTAVDLSLEKIAPLEDYDYAVVTGLLYKKAVNGFPSEIEYDELSKISEKLIVFMSEKYRAKHVGVFTYNGEKLHYFYVKDKITSETSLREFYDSFGKLNSHYINIEPDVSWKKYLDFLIPNKSIKDFYREELVSLGYENW